MLITGRRQRRIIFATLSLLTMSLAYEGEATEISLAVEEQLHFRHEFHLVDMLNHAMMNQQVVIY